MSTTRKRWLLGAGAALLVVGAAVGVASIRDDAPEAVEHIEQATEAGARAGRTSERIVPKLARIAENLEAAEGLSSRSAQIQALTTRQQNSLHDLAGVLRDQLDALRRGARSVGATVESASSVAGISGAQARVVAATVRSLRSLRADAASAGHTSAVGSVQGVERGDRRHDRGTGPRPSRPARRFSHGPCRRNHRVVRRPHAPEADRAVRVRRGFLLEAIASVLRAPHAARGSRSKPRGYSEWKAGLG